MVLEGAVSDCPPIKGVYARRAIFQRLAVVHECSLQVQRHPDQHGECVQRPSPWPAAVSAPRDSSAALRCAPGKAFPPLKS